MAFVCRPDKKARKQDASELIALAQRAHVSAASVATAVPATFTPATFAALTWVAVVALAGYLVAASFTRLFAGLFSRAGWACGGLGAGCGHGELVTGRAWSAVGLRRLEGLGGLGWPPIRPLELARRRAGAAIGLAVMGWAWRIVGAVPAPGHPFAAASAPAPVATNPDRAVVG